MPYTKKEVKFFSNILENYNKKPKPICKFECKNCREDNFSIFLGQNLCDNCGTFNGHVLGYFDIREKERFFYKKKSIYDRKYHYMKKVDEVSKIINLTEDEKDKLYNKLNTINNDIIFLQNKKFNRKRMININYLIKKILEENGNEKYKKINNIINPNTLKNYELWWKNYLSLR